MRDYAELCKSLRSCANRDGHMCRDCCLDYSIAYDNCFDMLKEDAADAIEELVAELVTLRNQLPTWISVEERLPPKGVE